MTLERILVAASDALHVVSMESDGRVRSTTSHLRSRRPLCLAAHPRLPGTAIWCGTETGLMRSDDDGASWAAAGLVDQRVTAVAVSPSDPDLVWAGTEPSAVWKSRDGGERWTRMEGLLDLPSASDWSFPPRPDTHHVRWIACDPHDASRLHVAVEAGALLSTSDAGANWRDRVPSGPHDTHELAIDPKRPDHLYAAAGDGWFESTDRGATWSSPQEGPGAAYLVSVALQATDRLVLLVSGASSARSAYRAGQADGRLFRREGSASWERVTDGWPDPAGTVAPLVTADPASGEFVAADERGVHRSIESGRRWTQICGYPTRVTHVRGLIVRVP